LLPSYQHFNRSGKGSADQSKQAGPAGQIARLKRGSEDAPSKGHSYSFWTTISTVGFIPGLFASDQHPTNLITLAKDEIFDGLMRAHRCSVINQYLGQSRVGVGNKKAAAFSQKTTAFWIFVAPQPGLEPGTYGLTA